MKKQTLLLLSLLGLLIIIGWTYFLTLKYKAPKTSDETQETPASISVLTFDYTKINAIDYIEGDNTLSLEKKDDKWIAKNVDHPLKQDIITGALSTFSTLPATKVVSEKADDISQYGLTNPLKKISFTLNDNSKRELLIGNQILDGNSYYVKLGDEDKIYAASSENINDMFLLLSNVRDITVLTSNLDVNDVNRISIKYSNGETIDSTLKNGIWTVKSPQANNLLVDLTYITDLIGELTGLSVIDVVDKSTDNLDKYGLNIPFAEIIISDSSNSYTMELGTLGDDITGFTFKNDNNIYTMYTTYAKEIYNETYDYLNKTPFGLEETDITSVSISTKELGTKILTLNHVETPPVNGNEATITTTYTLNDKAIEKDTISPFLDGLNSLSIKTQIAEEVSTSAPLITLNIKGKANVEAKFYTYDANTDFYYLELNGSRGFLMDKLLVDSCIEKLK